MLYLTYTLQVLMMLGFPVGLWLYLRRRLNASWGLIWAGVLTFVASQVVHLPLNGALGLLGGGGRAAQWPHPWIALAAGLSAGVCEEGARYLVYRFWRKDARSWAQGVTFGAGHGGGEAIILGGVMAASFVTMLALKVLGPGVLHVPGDQLGVLQTQMDSFWSVPWYVPLLGGLERAFALTIQVALSLLVLQSVVRRNGLWLLAAVGAHTLVDGTAVWMSLAHRSILAIEGVVLLFALGGLAIIFALRTTSREGTPIHADARGV